MNEFYALRVKAREKRDQTIAQAKQEYDSSLEAISKLERNLTGSEPKNRKLSACVDSVIPSEGEFSLDQLLAKLEILEPSRRWRKQAVNSHIHRLRKMGIVQRTSIHRKDQPSTYIRAGAGTERPAGDKTLPEVMVEALGNRSMTPVELTMAVLQAGYPTTSSRNGLRAAVCGALRKDKRFKRDGERWSI